MPNAYDIVAPFPRTVARRRRQPPMPHPDQGVWNQGEIADDDAQSAHPFEPGTDPHNEPYWATWGF